MCLFFFFFQAEDGIRDLTVTGVQTCALPIFLRRTLEDRHHCRTTWCPPRRRAPCFADRFISSGTGPAPLHSRSLCGVRAGDLKELSATAGHTYFSDAPRSRLYRKHRAAAARGGPLASGATGSVSAIVLVSRRAGTSRLGSFRRSSGWPCTPATLLLFDYPFLLACSLPGVFLRSNHGKLPARARPCVSSLVWNSSHHPLR